MTSHTLHYVYDACSSESTRKKQHDTIRRRTVSHAQHDVQRNCLMSCDRSAGVGDVPDHRGALLRSLTPSLLEAGSHHSTPDVDRTCSSSIFASSRQVRAKAELHTETAEAEERPASLVSSYQECFSNSKQIRGLSRSSKVNSKLYKIKVGGGAIKAVSSVSSLHSRPLNQSINQSIWMYKCRSPTSRSSADHEVNILTIHSHGLPLVSDRQGTPTTF